MSSALGMAHFTAALVAMALGAVLVCERKGTPTHRMIGVGYVLAMLVVNVTALCLYRLTGRFGPFRARTGEPCHCHWRDCGHPFASRALAAHALLLHGLVLRRATSCGLCRGSGSGAHLLRRGQQPYPSDRIGDGDCGTIRGIGSTCIGSS